MQNIQGSLSSRKSATTHIVRLRRYCETKKPQTGQDVIGPHGRKRHEPKTTKDYLTDFAISASVNTAKTAETANAA